MKIVDQSGAIVVRGGEEGPLILLVRSKGTPKPWIFPKGHIDQGESAEQAALREVWEEAGVRGVLIRAVGARQKFVSGTEQASVQHYLVYAEHCSASPENREIQWCSPAQALETLYYEDAKALLRSIETQILWWTRQHKLEANSFTQLILAELQHVGESFLRNEESGERRITFFMTFAGGFSAVVGFLVGKDGPLFAYVRPVVFVTLVILVLLGYSTLLRLVARNATSDIYKRRMAQMRQYFLTDVNDPHQYFMAFSPFQHAWRKQLFQKSLGIGGWLETMIVIEAILAGSCLASLLLWITEACGWTESLSELILIGTGFGVVVWLYLLRTSRQLYIAQMKPDLQ